MNHRKGLKRVAFVLRVVALLWLGFFVAMTVRQGGVLWVNYADYMLWRVVTPSFGLLILAWAIARFAEK